MARLAKKIPVEDLQRRLFQRLQHGADELYEPYTFGSKKSLDPTDSEFDWEAFLNFARFENSFQKVFTKDLAKVEFDLENIGVVEAPHGPFAMVNDVPMLFAWAGGDWEEPVHFFLYIDPKGSVRGYLPKEGNCYNRTTKTAYGNDEEADEDDMQKHYGVTSPDVRVSDADKASMIADAAVRIQGVP